MTVESLRQALQRPGRASSDLDLNVGQWQSQGPALRPAAVLLAVCERPSGPSVLLTKRASGLQHHPGQIALPGGKIDATDATPEAAALRELDAHLASIGEDTPAEDIQTAVYEIGKREEHGFASLRDWFKALYETLLGSEQGPRMGSFIALYGVANSRKLIAEALASA